MANFLSILEVIEYLPSSFFINRNEAPARNQVSNKKDVYLVFDQIVFPKIC